MATSPARAAPVARLPTDERSDRVQRVNTLLENVWRRGWADRPSLDPEALLAKARRATGLSDFGQDSGWRDRLDRLTAALHAEASLNPLGITIAHGQIVAALANRLRLAALWRRYPAIGDVPITAPVIIIGQMRSGSTRMQRLLACDPRLAFTRFFESWNPVPRWPCLPFDDRRLRGWSALAGARLLNPRFASIHPARTGDADEEIGLHNVSLYGAAFEAQWRIPAFARFGEQADSRPVYREFRRQLQSLRWLRGGRSDRPWILKLPQFAQDLDAVLGSFPDARLVILHRDPVAVVASSASLVHNQMTIQSDSVDRGWIGGEWLRKTALRQHRIGEARSTATAPSVDVDYRAMQDDWREQISRIYAMLGLTFTGAVERRMQRFLASTDHAALSGHRYDLTDFGLTEDRVRAAMAGRSGGDTAPRPGDRQRPAGAEGVDEQCRAVG